MRDVRLNPPEGVPETPELRAWLNEVAEELSRMLATDESRREVEAICEKAMIGWKLKNVGVPAEFR